MKDSLGRRIDYMRVSVTDRCNLNCVYCMPKETGFQMGQKREKGSEAEYLTFEEIEEVLRCGAALGIRQVRITGGEPLIREDLPRLVGMIKNIPEIEKATLTTNGVLLERYLKELVEKGIDGINISLDTADRDEYRKITGKDCFFQVIEGIRHAACQGVPIKINTVLLAAEGQWRSRWQEIAGFAKEYPIDVRFIEMMPIGYGKKYETVGNGELFQEIKAHYPKITRDERIHGSGPAVYYRIPGFKGSLGFISPIHGKFCSSCNRVRLTARGYLKTCLCYHDGADLLPLMRSGLEEEEKRRQITLRMENEIFRKPSAHCFESPEEMTEEKNMFMIGG